jgi:hypothetical protein
MNKYLSFLRWHNTSMINSDVMAQSPYAEPVLSLDVEALYQAPVSLYEVSENAADVGGCSQFFDFDVASDTFRPRPCFSFAGLRAESRTRRHPAFPSLM